MDPVETSKKLGDRVEHPSGATSSHTAPHYESIPAGLLRRIGERFQLGAAQHGRGNWLRSFELVLESPLGPDHSPLSQFSKVARWRYDIDFLRDRYNHAIEHLIALRESTQDDDHIGAVAWFLALAVDAENSGVNWEEVLRMRTPEDEAEYRANYQIRKATAK